MRALLWSLFVSSVWDQPTSVVAGRQERELIWLLYAWSAWVKPDIVVACTTCEGASLASVRSGVVVLCTGREGTSLAPVHSVDLGTDSLCVGRHNR